MHNIQKLPPDKETSFTTTLYIKNGKVGLYNNKTLQILQMQHFEIFFRKTSKYTYVLDLNKIVIRPRT